MKTLTVKANMDSLAELMSFVRHISLSYHANPEQLMAVELAVEEVVVNIIHYAYPDGKNGEIQLTYEWLEDKYCLINISDDGELYNPLCHEEPDINANIEERPIGGLGIFLTQQMMDKVCYKIIKGRNNLTIEKNLK